MSKAVLISIRPKWVEKIVNGEKTIEVRKTRPKMNTPFKCYIYCTLPKYPHEDFIATDYTWKCTDCKKLSGGIKCPPQSWCYVEAIKDAK